MRRARLCVATVAGTLAIGGGCKDGPPPCNPDEENFDVIKVLVQPSDTLNPDDDGTPLSVQLLIYQLAGTRPSR
jgi:predicted component of type VI protein secretion system